MSPPRPTPDTGSPLRQDVLDWFVRRHRNAGGTGDEAAFSAWLAADASHRDAYAQWQAHWQALDAMPADTVARLRAAPTRRTFLKPALAAAGVAAVATATGYFTWARMQAQPVYAQTFGTERGQQMDVPLPDGSRLRLDTATRLAVAFYRHRRDVHLLDGQALFSVHADASRPMHVLAGPVRVTVVGTRFAVRHTPGVPGAEGVHVAVEEGRVRVLRRDAVPGEDGHSAVDLTAGQQVSADPDGQLAPVAATPREGIASWRENRLSFVDIPLVRALAELERYGSTGLVVRDPAVAALRLSGTFDPRDAATLRRVLPSALPVRLRDWGSVTEVVEAR